MVLIVVMVREISTVVVVSGGATWGGVDLGLLGGCWKQRPDKAMAIK